MKQACVLLALLAAVFVNTVVGQTTCSYKTERLALTLSEESCAEACKNYSSKLNGPCFAYEYYPSREFCEGKVFGLLAGVGLSSDDSYDDSYVDAYYDSFSSSAPDIRQPGMSCGVNYGVDLTLPANSNEASASITAPERCSLERIDLGFKANEAECTGSCINLQSNVYGGCVAWFYNQDKEDCFGLLASGYYYSESVCGYIQP